MHLGKLSSFQNFFSLDSFTTLLAGNIKFESQSCFQCFSDKLKLYVYNKDNGNEVMI